MSTFIGFLFGSGLWLVLQSVSSVNAKHRIKLQRSIWPAFIDEIADGISVGMSLPEAFFEARHMLPSHYCHVVSKYYYQFQHGASFTDSLHRIAKEIHSQDFKRLSTLLVIGSTEGVHELAILLHDFATAIRRDNELFLEIRSKYQTNKIAARVASLSPLVVLFFTASRQEVRAIYLSGEGVVVLMCIALVSLGGYVAMSRIALLPGIRY